MPVGPSYVDGSRPSSAPSAASDVAPVTGTGRVCGMSESSAPRVTTVDTSSSAASPRISRTNCCHFMLGSMPCTRTMSRGYRGTRAT